MTPLCLIYKQTSRACFKRSNLEPLSNPKLSEINPSGSELRKGKTVQLAASLCEQQNLIHRTTSTAFNRGIFWVAWIFGTGKKQKQLSDSEIVKDCFLAPAEILFTVFGNKDAILK